MKDSLGDRMKLLYEAPFNHVLPGRLPTIIRLDGKAFHTFTKGMIKPFDESLIYFMEGLAAYLVESIQTCVMSYTQSDEISLLLHPYKKQETEPWFGGKI